MIHPPRKRGFTLVETLVAITIMTLAILAPFEAVQHVLNASRVSKDQLIASALAQEGLEYIRFVRDDNYLDNRNDPAVYTHILDGLSACTLGSKCTVDAIAAEVAICSGSCPLYLNSDGSYTQTNTGTSSIYTRTIQIDQNPSYETATVTVTWQDHGANSLVLTENFYDWI